MIQDTKPGLAFGDHGYVFHGPAFALLPPSAFRDRLSNRIVNTCYPQNTGLGASEGGARALLPDFLFQPHCSVGTITVRSARTKVKGCFNAQMFPDIQIH